MQLQFASKIPGDRLQVGKVLMDMHYAEAFGGEPPEAYERLLHDAMRGNLTLFSRRDWVEIGSTHGAKRDAAAKTIEEAAAKIEGSSGSPSLALAAYTGTYPPTDFPNYEPGSDGPARIAAFVRSERRRVVHGA